MYQRVNQILEQYPFEVAEAGKIRGAVVCVTDHGLKLLKEYKGSEARADFLYKVLLYLRTEKERRVDCIVRTREDRTVAVDVDETVYYVRDWYEGRECDTKNRDDILRAIRQLAWLHTDLRAYQGEVPDYLIQRKDNLLLENQKHSRELRKIKNYISGKRKRNEFEAAYLREYGRFAEQAEGIMELQERRLKDAVETELYGICHGEFNQHNVLFSREGCAVVNFEKACFDVQVGDLGNFMRKILEKHNWNLGLGMDMLGAYQKIRSLAGSELSQLYIRLAYPEKFWKIANRYYNSGKVWGCGRSMEKLKKLVEQEEAKESFLNLISHNLLF
ncbi:MAG: CotS family spore coat protein [Lachnospiraceae bacterium]|nr:CotS family spore coat protein [Lachnospiraceae bacterium]